MNVKREECYEESTDDECGAPSDGHQISERLPKKEEDVDTDDEFQAADDSEANAAEKGPRVMKDPLEESIERGAEGGGSQVKVIKTFEERLEELTAYTKHERDSNAFQKRVDELKAYKAKRGHLSVKMSEDKSLARFCRDIRYARRNPERRRATKLTEDRTASLDALGFDWAPQQNKGAFEKRLEELKAYKAKHGHLKVKESTDRSLAKFCVHTREAHRGIGTMKLTEQRIAALNALGFDWEPQHKNIYVFERRLEELKAYKAKHGHVNVKKSEDKSLARFCAGIRFARRNPERTRTMLTEERIASLDALGFDWMPRKKTLEETA